MVDMVHQDLLLADQFSKVKVSGLFFLVNWNCTNDGETVIDYWPSSSSWSKGCHHCAVAFCLFFPRGKNSTN